MPKTDKELTVNHETEVKREDGVLVQQLIEGVFGKRGQSPIYQTAGRLIEELSEQFIVALATVRREEREAALLEAAKDVCMYCDKRALGYGPATGPNEAGNYTHESVATTKPHGELCKASTIHARVNFEKTHSGIVSRKP